MAGTLERLRSSVLAKLMARTLVVLSLSVLLVEYVAYRKSSEQILRLTEERQVSLTALYAERFDRVIAKLEADLKTVRNLPSLSDYFLNRQYDLLAEADQQLSGVAAFLIDLQEHESAYSAIRIVDSAGEAVVSLSNGTDQRPPTRSPIQPQRPAGQQAEWAVASEDLGIIDRGIVPIRSGPQSGLAYALPLWIDAQYWGEVEIHLQLAALTDALARESILETGYLAVYHDDGRVIFDRRFAGAEPLSQRRPELVQALAQESSRLGDFSDEDGEPLLWSATAMERKPWKVVAIVPRSELLAGLDETRTLVAALIVLNVIIEFAFIFVFARRIIIAPIRRLVEGTRQVLSGNYAVQVEVTSSDEFGELATSFNRMTRSLDRYVEEVEARQRELSDAQASLHDKVGELETEVEERQRAATALEQRNAQFRALIDAIPAPIYYLDDEFVCLGCNGAFERFVGLSGEEIVGSRLLELRSVDLGEDGTRDLRAVVAGGGNRECETVMGSASRGDRLVVLHQAAFSKPDGNVAGVVGVMLDITERKAMEEELRQAQKMKVVGELTGGVAHDFNNLLAVIVGNLELLVSELPEESKLRRLADSASEAAHRGAALTGRLLAFSRQQALIPQLIDVNQLVEGMLDLVRRSLGETITVETRLSSVPALTRVDPGQLENALLNLAVNSRDAMPTGGVLTIQTQLLHLEGDRDARHGEPLEGEYVVLRVSDTGTGMSPETANRAFDPFFTTKDVGRGSGLGLSQVYGFVMQSGGQIGISSGLGRGTSVEILLERASGDIVEERVEPDIVPPARGSGEMILVVEDDAQVRRLAARMLTHLGYRHVEAEDGQSALAVLGETPEVTLLFTDVVLPGGMSGVDLAREAQQLRSDLRVLYASGYTERALLQDGRLEEGAALIGKPYRTDDLARKLSEVLVEARH